MIISNPQTIQVLLAGAVTTNELPIATAWANMADDGSTFAPDNTLAETNGTTAVDVLAAPSAGNKRQLKYLSVLNSDTASATVIVRVDASGTPTNLMRVVLAVGYRLEYTFTAGLRVFDASGALVGTGGGSGGGTVDSVIGGTGIDVDATDPANPIVELDAAAIASLALADSATQPGDAVTTLNMATARLLGRSTASSGAVEEITLGTNLSFAGTTLNAAAAAAWGSITGTLSSQTDLQAALDAKAAVGIPQNSKSAAYTLVLSDAGKHIFHPSADTTARTFTIPANASVAFPIGTAVTFVNQNAAGVVTIAITTDTMRLAGAGTTGSRTLAANGMATALKVTATEWIISGTGLT